LIWHKIFQKNIFLISFSLCQKSWGKSGEEKITRKLFFLGAIINFALAIAKA